MNLQKTLPATSRRDFVSGMTKTAFAGSVLALPWRTAFGADCTAYDSVVTAAASETGATVQFWVDGVHFGSRSNLASRANVAVFIDLAQSAGSYVERVYVMGANDRVIQARIYGPNDKMADGRVPYTIFENLALDPAADYRLGYVIKTGATAQHYVAAMNDPVRTALNTTWLPTTMRNDFKTFLADNSQSPTPGLISTPFQFYTLNGIATHSARARFHALGGDGTFTVEFDFMHGDVNAQHFMRYFLVLDPVGRFLGFEKRPTNGAPLNNGGANNTWRVFKITNQQKTDFGIPDVQVADIRDCPFVRVFTDCNYDAMTEQVIRLR